MTTETRPVGRSEPCCGVAALHIHDEDGAGGAAAVFKALSDPTRLRILKVVSQMRELCEGNIVPAFGLSQPTISYHLKVLREAGLIESDRRGQWVYHRVSQRALLGAVRHLTEIA